MIEFIERVRTIRRMMARGLDKREIKATCTKQWGVSWWTVERYMRRAQEVNRDVLGKTIEELQANSIAVYQDCLQDPNASWHEKIKAQERIDKLLGLERREPMSSGDQLSHAAVFQRMLLSVPPRASDGNN